MIGDEIPTVHVFDPRTGEFLGSLPANTPDPLGTLRKRQQHAPIARQPETFAEYKVQQKALEAEARFALDQPWYVQADAANAAGMAMTMQALRMVVPTPKLDRGDLSYLGPGPQVSRDVAPMQTVVVGDTAFQLDRFGNIVSESKE